MAAEFDIIVFGGARGGGKTYVVSGNKAVAHVREYFSEEYANLNRIDTKGYRILDREDGRYFYKISIDYPHYSCVIVRHTEPQLMTTIKPMTDLIYPGFGGKWVKSDMTWYFPSGAQVILRSCEKEAALDFFKSGNFKMLIIEELTEFKEEWVEKMEGGCRSTDPILKAMKVYTTNPGEIGHSWVKNKFVKPCLPVPDGKPIYNEEFGISYQPLKANKPAKTKSGEEFIFIPSLVFDNPHLVDNDRVYIKNLLGKNEILKQMWLFGNWDVFAGQFFDMFDYGVHVIDEYTFFGADKDDLNDLDIKRKSFNWSDYRLFRSYDYGYAEQSAWVCGAFALHKYTGDIVQFAEITETKLTAKLQAQRVKEYFYDVYRLKTENFEKDIADPKSFWEKIDTGDTFKTPWDYYAEEGIILIPANNARQSGAMAVLDAMTIRKSDGLPRLRWLSCCTETVDCIVNLPADPNHPNDVNTKAYDHHYDMVRYYVFGLKEDFTYPEEEKPLNWHERLAEKFKHEEDFEDKGWIAV